MPHTKDMNEMQTIARYTILVTATAHCNERLSRTAQTLAEATAMADGFMTHPVTDKVEVFDRWANKRYEATRQVVAA